MAECALGVFFVLGHNVWRVLPNEVYLLAGVALLSLWIRNGGYRTVGIRGPRSWTWTLLGAVVTGVLLQLKGYVTEPLGQLFTQQPQHVSKVMPHVHDLRQTLIALLIVWTFAGFGEEFADTAPTDDTLRRDGGGGWPGKLTGLVAVKPAVRVSRTSTKDRLAYLTVRYQACCWELFTSPRETSGRAVLAHGFSDTVAVAAYYLGWGGI